MKNLVEKHYIQDGEDFFQTELSTEELLTHVGISSNGTEQILGRRIAEQADKITLLETKLNDAWAINKDLRRFISKQELRHQGR